MQYIMMFLAPLLLFVFGALIRFGNKSILVSGLDSERQEEKSKYNEEALCKSVGNLLFILGIVMMILPIAQLMKVEKLGLVIAVTMGIFATVTIIGLVYFNKSSKFKK